MKKILLHIAVLLVLAMSVEAQDVPRVISYQGVLVGADGKPESGNVDVTFELMPLNGAPSITWLEQRKGLAIRGGLFHVFLGDSSMPKGFPILSGEYALSIKVGTNAPNFVRFGSVPYALNIPNDVVTSAKIKDAEVKAEDIGSDEVVKSIEGLKDAVNIIAGNANIRIRVSGQDIIIEGKDTVKAAEQLIGGVPSGVPIGTIVAYYGDISNTSDIPDGWLLCDSSTIPTGTEYAKLRQICQNNGHAGVTPNLRGQFLRGAGITFQRPTNNPDPDFNGRTGGSSIFKIGSVQPDAFQRHNHGIATTNEGFGLWSYNASLTLRGRVTGWFTDTNGGSIETRPKNVYVNYIIKAR